MTTNATVTVDAAVATGLVDAIKVAEQRLGRFIIFTDFSDAFKAKDSTGAVDDMLVSYFKTLTDNYRVADAAVRDFRKSLADSGVVTDSAVMALLKAAFDVVSMTDSALVAVSKYSVDTARASDIVSLAAGKISRDTASALDAAQIQYAGVKQDGAGVVDASILSILKQASISAGVSDVPAFSALKQFADTVGATDDIDGAASVLDDQEMIFFKVMSNIASASDTLASAYLKPFFEQASVSDTGLLWSQDYCDFSYFSEDFVGSSRSF